MIEEYEDNYWAEDAIFLERNSRDFVSRIERINMNAEAICQTLRASPIGKSTHEEMAPSKIDNPSSESSLLPQIQSFASFLRRLPQA